jgi:hypothetical protein
MQNQETVQTITDAVKTIIRIAGIEDKTGLDNWCGGPRRTRMYDEVRGLAPAHYNRLEDPHASVRACYEAMLPGYKIYRH